MGRRNRRGGRGMRPLPPFLDAPPPLLCSIPGGKSVRRTVSRRRATSAVCHGRPQETPGRCHLWASRPQQVVPEAGLAQPVSVGGKNRWRCNTQSTLPFFPPSHPGSFLLSFRTPRPPIVSGKASHPALKSGCLIQYHHLLKDEQGTHLEFRTDDNSG